MRKSKLALVLVRVDTDRPKLLLIRHHKWNDWSLVGGHVEPWEKNDFAAAAARECNEEMTPLKCGKDFVLLPLLVQPTEWGPVASKSAGGEPTIYTAQFFELRFLREPGECIVELLKAHPGDFRLADLEEFQLPEGEVPLYSTSLVSRALRNVGRALGSQPAKIIT